MLKSSTINIELQNRCGIWAHVYQNANNSRALPLKNQWDFERLFVKTPLRHYSQSTAIIKHQHATNDQIRRPYHPFQSVPNSAADWSWVETELSFVSYYLLSCSLLLAWMHGWMHSICGSASLSVLFCFIRPLQRCQPPVDWLTRALTHACPLRGIFWP